MRQTVGGRPSVDGVGPPTGLTSTGTGHPVSPLRGVGRCRVRIGNDSLTRSR